MKIRGAAWMDTHVARTAVRVEAVATAEALRREWLVSSNLTPVVVTVRKEAGIKPSRREI